MAKHNPASSPLLRKSAAGQAALAGRPYGNGSLDALDDGAVLLRIVSTLDRGSAFEEQVGEAVAMLPAALGARRAVLVLTGEDILGTDIDGPLVIEAGAGMYQRVPSEVTDWSPFEQAKHEAVTAAPIKVAGRVVGILTLSLGPAPLDDRRSRLLGSVLDAISARCERARTAVSLMEQAAGGALLQSAVRLAAGAGPAAEKLRLLATMIVDRVGGALVAIGRRDEAEAAVRWTVAVGPSGEREELLGYAEPIGIVSTVLSEAAPVVLNDVPWPGTGVLGPFAGEGRSAMALPLALSPQTAGVLLVVSPLANAFTHRGMREVTSLGDVVAALLRTVEMQQRLEAGQGRDMQRLEAFHAAASSLTLQEDPEGALRQFVDSARQLVGARYGGVVVWDKEDQVRRLVSLGLDDSNGNGDVVSLRTDELLGLLRYALVQERKSAIRVADSTLLPNKADPEVPLLRSFLGVPFAGKDGTHGAFFLVDKEGMPRFSADDERLLQLYSSMAAVLLNNIHLYDDLERQHRTLQGIQNSMEEGLVVLDAEGGVILSNPAANRLSGADLSQLVGVPFSVALRQGEGCFETPEPVRELAAFLESSRTSPRTFEMTLVRPRRCDLTVSVFPIEISPTELLTGLLLRDVSDERDLQRRRDTFVSVASHELRTPMTTILGFTELLLKRDATPEQRTAWLEHVYDDSNRVISIVDDLLNVSRIQSGKMNVSREETDAVQLIREAVDALRSSSDLHQIVVKAAPGLPPVIADPGKVVQVLVNLISNAIKYSPRGGAVVVSAHADQPNGRVILAVKDQGIGIADEHLTGLFTTFQRIERDETRAIRGTGLGLYIVKSLVELMGGEVWVESKLDKGSTFSLSLPIMPR